MKYAVLILRRAQKELANISRENFDQIRDATQELGDNPRPEGCIKLRGRDGWRIRVGNYRIVYEIDDDQMSVTVLNIGHGRDIYR